MTECALSRGTLSLFAISEPGPFGLCLGVFQGPMEILRTERSNN